MSCYFYQKVTLYVMCDIKRVIYSEDYNEKMTQLSSKKLNEVDKILPGTF